MTIFINFNSALKYLKFLKFLKFETIKSKIKLFNMYKIIKN